VKTPSRFIVWIFFLFPLLAASPLRSQTQPATAPALNEAEKKGIIGRELIFHRRYDEALEYFKKLDAEDPDSPLGTFGQMAVWQSRMFENFDFRFDREFQEVSEPNKKIVERILDQKDSSAWDLFLAGASAGVRSFYLMRKDSAFKALGEAGIAKKALDRAHEKDPSFADVYLGLGMYDYWRSVFTNRLRFLPFFSDRRKEGLATTEKAFREARVVGPLAEASLGFCYYEERNPSKAIPLWESFLKKYPEYAIAKTMLGDLYGMSGNYPRAHQIFDELIQNNPDVAVARYFKAKTYFRQNKLPEARKEYEDFLNTKPTDAWTAYALTDLGLIDLREGKENDAYEKFKRASRTYPDYTYPLHQLQKLRGRRW
jgi:tetratricopeptide (TPR) repeat protein